MWLGIVVFIVFLACLSLGVEDGNSKNILEQINRERRGKM